MPGVDSECDCVRGKMVDAARKQALINKLKAVRLSVDVVRTGPPIDIQVGLQQRTDVVERGVRTAC
ncbi:MAG: hypothetical protein U0168_07760 [Nannocystaceae bacterium]